MASEVEENEARFKAEGEVMHEGPYFDLSSIVHERLKAHGRRIERDDILVKIATEMSMELANRQIGAATTQYNAELVRIADEYEQKRLALVNGYNVILGMVRPLIANLQLGPDEWIASIAVKSSTGDIRVVNIEGDV